MAVRGLSASSLRWKKRLAAMPRVLTPVRATVIQIKTPQPGHPSAASTIPMKQKGRA